MHEADKDGRPEEHVPHGDGERVGKHGTQIPFGTFFSKECHILSGKGKKRGSPKRNTLKSVIFLS